MRGSVLLTLTLTILLLGATSATAQTTSLSLVDEVMQNDESTSAVVTPPRATPINTRHDIRAAMLDIDTQSGAPQNAELDQRGRRNVLYIVGGTLIAGGITAAIILLTGDDDDGIPAPPGRPSP